MICPRCSFQEDKVIDSRISKEGNSVRRRRECIKCSHRFTTLEEIIPTELYVIKHDQSREDYKPNKIRDGIKKACWKRPVSEDQFDHAVNNVQMEIENLAVRDVPSEKIGQIIMDELKNLDHIAYVRFASVYRQFKDVDEFINEIKSLKKSEK